MLEILHGVVFVLIFTGLVVNFLVVKKLDSGIMGLLYIFFGFGIFFEGLSVVFDFMNSMTFYQLADITFHFWLHILVYCALASIVWGGYRIKHSIDKNTQAAFTPRDGIFLGLLFAAAMVVFILPQLVEPYLFPVLLGSVFDNFGLHHGIALLGAFVGGVYLHFIKGKWGLFGQSLTFVTLFLVFVGIQHGWEVITESEKLKLLTLDNPTIEGVEALLMLVGTSLFAYGQWVIYRVIRQ